MQNDNIDTIIDRLNRLTLQQQQLTQQIAELQTEIRNRNEAVSTTTINASNQLSGEQSSTTNRVKKRPLAVGDRVRIKNPKKDQPSIGVIDSYTPSKLFVRIKLDNSNLIINRAPRNVARINHDNNQHK
jgi:cell division septum initiation protein DivIVA